MKILGTFQRLISQGPYSGMVETITDKTENNRKMLCYLCGDDPGNLGVWSIIGDCQGNAYCARCLCAACAFERIAGIPDVAGKSPYQPLDPRKERRRLQDRKNNAWERRKESMTRVLFGLIIGFAYLASAAFIIVLVCLIIKFFS